MKSSDKNNVLITLIISSKKSLTTLQNMNHVKSQIPIQLVLPVIIVINYWLSLLFLILNNRIVVTLFKTLSFLHIHRKAFIRLRKAYLTNTRSKVIVIKLNFWFISKKVRCTVILTVKSDVIL